MGNYASDENQGQFLLLERLRRVFRSMKICMDTNFHMFGLG